MRLEERDIESGSQGDETRAHSRCERFVQGHMIQQTARIVYRIVSAALDLRAKRSQSSRNRMATITVLTLLSQRIAP